MPRRSTTVLSLVAVASVLAAGCGSSSEPKLSADGVETCVAAAAGPAGESSAGDSRFAPAFFADDAAAAKRSGRGYFNVFAVRDGSADATRFPGAAHTDFVFYADSDAASAAVKRMRARTWHTDGPRVADRYGNLVVVYGLAPPARYRSFIEDCLGKAASGARATTALVDPKWLAARAAAQRRREAALAQSARQQVETIVTKLDECIPSAASAWENAADYSSSQYSSGAAAPGSLQTGILTDALTADPMYDESGEYFSEAANTEFDVALFFDARSAAAAQPALDRQIRQIKSTARAVLMGRAIMLAGRGGLAVRGKVSSCVASAEAAVKATAGRSYSGPGGRSVSDRAEAENGFTSG